MRVLESCIMKCFLIAAWVLSSFLISSCKEKVQKPVAVKNLTPIEDTFQFINVHTGNHKENPHYVMPGFIIDSAEYRAPGATVSFYFNLPKLSKTEFPQVVKWMNDLLMENRASYRELQTEVQNELQMDVFDEFLGTKLLYKDSRILSIVLDTWVTDGMHRSVWNHFAFNYDIVKKKRIYVGDYFKLESPADTVFLNYFLRKSVSARPSDGFDISSFGRPVGSDLDFAFDSANVYFFFSRYSLYGIGYNITAIPKKYIKDHIRPEYR